VMPTMAAVVVATRPWLASGRCIALPSRARSIRSPATRDQSHSAGCGLERMPMPLTTSRRPIIRKTSRLRSSSLMPMNRAISPGAVRLARPRPRLSQPRALAIVSVPPCALFRCRSSRYGPPFLCMLAPFERRLPFGPLPGRHCCVVMVSASVARVEFAVLK
jgi:hypothetical protein